MSEFRLNDEANNLLASLYTKLAYLTGYTGSTLNSLICDFCTKYAFTGNEYSDRETPKEMFGDLASCLDSKWDSISGVCALLPMSLQDMINILDWMCEYTKEVICHCGEPIELSIANTEKTCPTCNCYYSLNLDDFGYINIDNTDCKSSIWCDICKQWTDHYSDSGDCPNAIWCDICGNYTDHYSSECPNIETCEYCGEEFSSDTIAEHLDTTHHWWCSICDAEGYADDPDSALQAHQESHHYKCPWCDDYFESSYDHNRDECPGYAGE